MEAQRFMEKTVILDRRAFNNGLLATAVLHRALPLVAEPAGSSPHGSLLELQQRFLDLRFGMFIHLNMATFEQREWGDPLISPKLFNPAHLDTDQWAQAARSANMGYGCLTTKHHDGFCLWPTATSSPSVKDSSYPHDIVRSYVDSFRRAGLKVCLYLSVLDLRANIRANQVTPEKVALIKTQLTELLTNYGEITALVFDGWNAGWSRIGYDQLPFRTLYDHIKSLQPNCLVMDHNAGQYPGPVLYYTDIKEYEQHAGQKLPAGSLVPSQSGTTLQSEWFWKTDYPTQALRPARQIVDEWLIPFNEQHCNLILNVAPNRDGRFDSNAVMRLAEVGKLWSNPGRAAKIKASIQITAPNLALAQPAVASSSADTSGPDLANDDNFESNWTADDGKQSAWLEIDFRKPAVFNTVVIAQPGKSSRLTAYAISYWRADKWIEILSGGVPELYQLHQFPRVTSSRVRLTLTGGPDVVPSIAEFGIYNEPIA